MKSERLQDLVVGRIRFTQPSAQNDPFEFQPFYEAVVSADLAFEQIHQEHPHLMRDLITKAVAKADLPPGVNRKTITRLLLSSGAGRIQFEAAQAVTKIIAVAMLEQIKQLIYEQLNAKVGILSLTDTPFSKRMWVQYGDKGRGMAFVFDATASWLNRRRGPSDEFYHPQKVNYVDLGAGGRTFLTLADENLLISKGLSWSREREWRMLVPLGDAVERRAHPDGAIHLFDLDVSAITAVIVGPKASGSTVDAVRKLMTSNPRLSHIQIRCVRSNAGTLELLGL